MSSIPQPDKKPKYNQNKPYEWVDSQWEKLMNKQKELEDEITNLTGKIKNDMDYIRMLEGWLKESKENLETCTKHHSKLWDNYKELKLEKNNLQEELLDLEEDCND